MYRSIVFITPKFGGASAFPSTYLSTPLDLESTNGNHTTAKYTQIKKLCWNTQANSGGEGERGGRDPISAEELQYVISQTKSRSTPSPNDQTPYVVLKHCPSLSAIRLNLHNACWSSASVPAAWKRGVVRLIPKLQLRKTQKTPATSDQ